MEDCVEGVFTRRPIADNYFWRVYLLGRYSKDCCPEYLRQPQFERLKAGLVDRIQTHTSDLTSFFRKHPDPISRFVLLDHMDWLSHEHPQALADEWQAIIDKARPDARFLWRSGGFHVDYVDPIQVQYKGRSSTVGELLVYDTMRAADLHQRDRVNTYGSFYLARLAS
jgi:S-adenosylmethionine-diacylglycerol 3-amino-3-carboxypropyl transferase